MSLGAVVVEKGRRRRGPDVDVLLECGGTLIGPTPEMAGSTPSGPMAATLSGVSRKLVSAMEICSCWRS